VGKNRSNAPVKEIEHAIVHAPKSDAQLVDAITLNIPVTFAVASVITSFIHRCAQLGIIVYLHCLFQFLPCFMHVDIQSNSIPSCRRLRLSSYIFWRCDLGQKKRHGDYHYQSKRAARSNTNYRNFR
jgi:hypothetical protein